jgi:hypothetical protein
MFLRIILCSTCQCNFEHIGIINGNHDHHEPSYFAAFMKRRLWHAKQEIFKTKNLYWRTLKYIQELSSTLNKKYSTLNEKYSRLTWPRKWWRHCTYRNTAAGSRRPLGPRRPYIVHCTYILKFLQYVDYILRFLNIFLSYWIKTLSLEYFLVWRAIVGI